MSTDTHRPSILTKKPSVRSSTMTCRISSLTSHFCALVLEFLEEYGFVVIRCLSAAECAATVDDLFADMNAQTARTQKRKVFFVRSFVAHPTLCVDLEPANPWCSDDRISGSPL